MVRVLAFLLVVLAALPASARAPQDALPSLAPMIERVAPGVVNISVRATVERPAPPLFRDPFFRRFFDLPPGAVRREVQSVGSGVVVDAEEGLVVTNHHVVENADEIVVVLADRRRRSARLVGADPETDVALLEIDPEGLTDVPYGDSDALRVGDFVVAIGNPFGIGQTATIGMVSALQRSGLGIEGYENFIQTDASINPGNSGGALVNQQGELVGINTAILSRSGGNVGIGFAIPSNMVRRVVEQIETHGEVRRGRLGVLAQDLTPDIAEAMGLDVRAGAVISRVTPGSAAAQAGLEAGDVVVALDGRSISSAADLRNAVGLRRPGETVRLRVLRGGRAATLDVELEPRETEVAAAPGEVESGGRLAGVALAPLPDDHPMAAEVDGVLVRSLEPGSPAARAGLRPGDVIVEANGRPVRHPADVRRAARHSGERPLLLAVRRGEGALFVAVP